MSAKHHRPRLPRLLWSRKSWIWLVIGVLSGRVEASAYYNTHRPNPRLHKKIVDADISASTGHHSCAVTQAGSVKCWGRNYAGKLGQGNTVDTVNTTPRQVLGLFSNAQSVVTGIHHTCALMKNGKVYCMGDNVYRQLANGTTDSPHPVLADGISNATSLHAREHHTCALISDGSLKCWGHNQYGKLGDGTTVNRASAVTPTGLGSGVTDVKTAANHTCAVVNGGIKCWGYGDSGRLGHGATTNSLEPVDVTNFTTDAVAVAVENSAGCGISSSGGLKCWGANADGRLGVGDSTQRLTATQVSGLTAGVTKVVLGRYHTCAIVSGGVKCWGNGSNGRVGDGGSAVRNTPVDVTGLTAGSGVKDLSANNEGSCAITSDDSVKCWGSGTSFPGNVGAGSSGNATTPVDIPGLSANASKLISADESMCVLLKNSGGLKCWGQNDYGKLGLGHSLHSDSWAPVEIADTTSYSAIAPANTFTCGITTTGAVRCWGTNSNNGVLGDNTTVSRTTPGPALVLDGSTLSAASLHSTGVGTSMCASTTTGAAYCWGSGNNGRLGNSASVVQRTPVQVTGLTAGTVTKLSSGNSSTCALLQDGSVRCWGMNTYGRLGDGTSTDRNSPVNPTGLTANVSDISSGQSHVCAVVDGGVKCWGHNQYGKLGDNTTVNKLTPTQVSGLTASSGYVQVVASVNNSCALHSGGTVKCWGAGGNGQLGNNATAHAYTPVDVIGLTNAESLLAIHDTAFCAKTTTNGLKCWGDGLSIGTGTTTDQKTAVDVPGLTSGVTSVVSIYRAACALKSGAVYCWGTNDHGQIGIGTLSNVLSPTLVPGLTANVTSIWGHPNGYNPNARHFCAIFDTGRVHCWGRNNSGQLGIDPQTRQPESVIGFE